MKKWIAILLALLLVGNLGISALAAEDTLSLSDAVGQEGETVYLALSLNETVQGNTMGIRYSYDASLLEALPESCSWSIKGLMKDFDYNGAGVWASGNTQGLSGNICVLAFKIKAPLASGTEVTCTLTIKDGAADMGTYTAQATVTTACSHTYGEWSDGGTIGHSRACTLCGASQTQSHSWDNGVVTDNPANPATQLKTFTCTACGGTKTTEIQKEQEDPLPQYTMPETTAPPIPEYSEPYRPESTRPTLSDHDEQSQPGNNNRDDWDRVQPSGDYHVHADGSIHYGDHEAATIPVTDAAEEVHDHTHETQSTVTDQTRYTNAALSVVIVCLMFAAGSWYLKKKKR